MTHLASIEIEWVNGGHARRKLAWATTAQRFSKAGARAADQTPNAKSLTWGMRSMFADKRLAALCVLKGD